MLSSVNTLKNYENSRKNTLRDLFNDYELSYETLSEKAGRTTVKVSMLRALRVEIY